MKSRALTPERARALLKYDPTTGIVRRRPETVAKGKTAAAEVSTINKDGYLCVKLDGTVYLLHRVIFLIMEGRWAEPTVDHENRKPLDNRWSNLREATQAVQNANKVAGKRSTTPGVRLTLNTGRYSARPTINGRIKRLGTYDTPEQAVEAIAHHKAGMLL